MTDALQSRYDPRPFGGDYSDEDESKMQANLTAVFRFLMRMSDQYVSVSEIRVGAGLSPDAEVTARSGVYKYCLRSKAAE
jgi:hypothetical protein